MGGGLKKGKFRGFVCCHRGSTGNGTALEMARDTTDVEMAASCLAIFAGPSVSRFSCFNYNPLTFCHQDNLFVLSGLWRATSETSRRHSPWARSRNKNATRTHTDGQKKGRLRWGLWLDVFRGLSFNGLMINRVHCTDLNILLVGQEWSPSKWRKSKWDNEHTQHRDHVPQNNISEL